MKVFKTDVNKISLHSLILQLQLTLGLFLFKEIISVYSDLLVLISNYSFLFENSSSEIQVLKGNPVSVVVALISEAPARDGANWYGYAGCNPMVYVDKIGLFASNGFEGPFTADHYGVTPEMGPQTDPNATPQNQTPNITGGGGNYQDFWNSFSNGFTNTLNSLFNLDFGTDFGSKAWDSFRFHRRIKKTSLYVSCFYYL